MILTTLEQMKGMKKNRQACLLDWLAVRHLMEVKHSLHGQHFFLKAFQFENFISKFAIAKRKKKLLRIGREWKRVRQTAIEEYGNSKAKGLNSRCQKFSFIALSENGQKNWRKWKQSGVVVHNCSHSSICFGNFSEIWSIFYLANIRRLCLFSG